MTLCDSKKKLALAGAGCGVVAAVLAFLVFFPESVTLTRFR